MSRLDDISRALSDSFQDYDETLRRRLGQTRDEQVSPLDHLIDVNDDHQVTREDVGLSHIENYPIATPFVIDEADDPNHYVDIEGAIYYIRSNLNLGQVVDSGDPISPIGSMDINTLRPKLTGGAYFNAYGIQRKHRRYQLALASGDFDAPLLDVVVTGNDLVLGSDLTNLTEYMWRYKDISVDDIEGPWKTAEFRAAYEIVLTPTLTLSGDPQSASLSPMAQGTAFAVNTGTDVHTSSVWTLYDDQDTVLETFTKTTGTLTEWTPSTTLAIVSDYRIEVYYVAETYEQSGVAAVSFTTTDGLIETPTVTIPTEPVGPFTVDLSWNGTTPASLDTHVSSSLQIATDAAFTDIVVDVSEDEAQKTSIVVDSLADLSTYYVRAKVHGDFLGGSAWSATQTLQTGVFEGTSTQLQDPTGDVSFTTGTGHGQDSVLGGHSTQSPGQPLVVYRTPQAVLWATRIEDVVDEGTITSVKVSSNRVYVTGVQTDETVSFIAALDLSGTVLWCQTITGGSVMVLTDLVAGDKVYAVGYSDGHNGTGQAGISAIVIAMTTTGTQQWARTVGGSGTDKFHGVDYSGGTIYAVGSQDSDFGTTVTAAQCASVVAIGGTGTLEWERYWGIGNSAVYHSALIEGSYLYAVGSQDGMPVLSTYYLSSGSSASHHTPTGLSGTYRQAVLDGSSIFISGQSSAGAILTRTNRSVAPTASWTVQDNQAAAEGFAIVTDNGTELVSGLSQGGRRSAVISRIPINGSVGTPPYLTGYDWITPSVSWDTQSVTEAQVFGAFTQWQTVDANRNRNSGSGTNPPSVGTSEISYAVAAGYSETDTVTHEYRNLEYLNPTYYSYNSSYWQDHGTGSVNAPLNSYNPLQESYAQSLVPTDTSTRRYYYDSQANTGGSVDVATGPWSDWSYAGTIYDSNSYATYQELEDALMAKYNDEIYVYYTQSRHYRVSNIVSPGSTFSGYLEYEYRTRPTTEFFYHTVYYSVQRLVSDTTSGYRWSLYFEERSRTLSPVQIPLTTLVGLNAVYATPIQAPVTFELQYSNF